ncbi:hypothetical protein GF373_11300 [bacterium]|nr:hypothetical protein [bacterium]
MFFSAQVQARNVIRKGKKQRRFLTLPIGMNRVDIVYSVPRLQCHECGDLRQAKNPFRRSVPYCKLMKYCLFRVNA